MKYYLNYKIYPLCLSQLYNLREELSNKTPLEFHEWVELIRWSYDNNDVLLSEKEYNKLNEEEQKEYFLLFTLK